MKKITGILLLMFACHLSMRGQNMSEAEMVELIESALTYARNGKTAEAKDLLLHIERLAVGEMRQRVLPKLSLAYYSEGLHYYIELNLNEALVWLGKARDGSHEGGFGYGEALACIEIGSIKEDLDDVQGAFDAYQRASTVASFNGKDAKFMDVLLNVYKLSQQLGYMPQAYRTRQRMDSLAAVTNSNEASFLYHRFLGSDAMQQGRYDLAEYWYRKNDAYIGSLGDDYTGANRGLHYSCLYKLFEKSGQNEDALRYALMYKAEFQGRRDESASDYYEPYWGLARIYSKIGDSIRCFECLDTLFLSMPRLNELEKASILFVPRGFCYSTFKQYDKALADFKHADELLATQYDESNSFRISILGNMAGMEHQLGHYAESERLYRKYAEGTKRLYGDNHLQYIDALGYLANAEAFAGHIEQACNDYTTAVDKLKMLVQSRLPYLTSAERESYWNMVSELFQNMAPFALEAREYQTGFTRVCYDGLVLLKAFLLESERSAFDLIRTNGTDEDLRDYSTIASLQAKIRRWESQGSSMADSILTLTTRIRQLEAGLAERCRSFGDITRFMAIGYQEIRDHLGDGDVLIDFTDFVSRSRGRIYAAYLVDGRQDNPLLQKLFAESKVDSMQVAYPDQYYERPYADTLYQLIWMPFKDHVNEGATVYYVPSQMLFQIALESLPMEDGTLLGDHYHFVRLSSARELLTITPNLNLDLASVTPNAVLYGGLQYELEAADWEAEVGKYEISPLLAVRGDMLRGDSIFRPLPGTLQEVNAIEQILRNHRQTVESYTGKRGTEESFLSMDGVAPRILHVATHGFFYTPEEADRTNYLRGYRDAMSLSGLVMAGGNAAWIGRELPEGVLSGILTASKIAQLDLSGTDMVVLSACQSGIGRPTSEGLYGLQRAFKKAGVQTLVMSLWKISDSASTEFMAKFYENLVRFGWDKRRAFNETKNYIRTQTRYRSPYYWAGFVMLD